MEANAPLIQTREEAPLTIRRGHVSRRSLVLKRMFDVAAALILIFLLLPLWPVIGILIRLTSPGPIVFCQRRVGKRRRVFAMYKFRSMVENAHSLRPHLRDLNEARGHLFKIKQDPRITAVGRWLRRYSLDELPQLINVLRGDMTLVGPRPMPVEEVAYYAPWHHQRHSVTPGLTGLWQINGRSDLSFDQMIALDFQYIEKCSLRMDLEILSKTILVVLRGKGAY